MLPPPSLPPMPLLSPPPPCVCPHLESIGGDEQHCGPSAAGERARAQHEVLHLAQVQLAVGQGQQAAQAHGEERLLAVRGEEGGGGRAGAAGRPGPGRGAPSGCEGGEGGVG